jgi:hypothetical protein
LALDEVDERVREVLLLIASGEWGTARMLEYAEEHGVSINTVYNWSAQAHRVQRFLRGDNEEYRQRLLANLEFAGHKALSLERSFTNKDGEERVYACPDIKAYIAAQVEQARMLGVDKPKPESDGNEAVPVEQLAAALRQLGWKAEPPHEQLSRPEPAPVGATREPDTERPGPERVEGFLESDEED